MERTIIKHIMRKYSILAFVFVFALTIMEVFGLSLAHAFNPVFFAQNACQVRLAKLTYGGTASPVTTHTITIPATSTGNTLIVTATWAAPNCNLTSVTDNASGGSNSYVTTNANGNYSFGTTSIWYAKNVKAGATSVTISSSTCVGEGVGVAIYEVAGLSATSPLDQASGTGELGRSTTANAPLVTPTSACTFIVSAVCVETFVTSGTNAFTNFVDIYGNGQSYYLTQSASGSYGASWSLNSAGFYSASTVNFK